MIAFISLLAVCYIFLLILRNVYREWRNGDFTLYGRHNNGALFKVPMDVYMFSLFLADFLQALGACMGVKWIYEGIVRSGDFCNGSGLLLSLGRSAIAITALLITLHTFIVIWWGESSKEFVDNLKTATCLVVISWLFLILSLTIPIAALKSPPFYAPTPHLCWISKSYPELRLAFQNCWLGLSFATIILYFPLLGWLAGYVALPTTSWWKFDVHGRRGTQNRTLLLMALCALAYTSPMAPTRFFQLIHSDNRPFGNPSAELVIDGLFLLSGVVDTTVFLLTRKGLLLIGRSPALDARAGESPLAQLDNLGPIVMDRRDSRSDPDNDGEGAQPSKGSRNNSISAPRLESELTNLRGRTLKWSLALMLWIGLNGADVFFIKYFVISATRPNPHTIINDTGPHWIGWYVTTYFYGFGLGALNIFVLALFVVKSSSYMEHHTDRRKLGRLVYCLVALLAPFLILGPFFAPIIGFTLSRKFAWKHKCTQFTVEIILDGVPYGKSQDVTPKASFYFWKNNVRTNLFDYDMINDPNSDLWHLNIGRVDPQLTPSSQWYPTIQNVSFSLSDYHFSGNCSSSAGDVTNATQSCIRGSYDPKGPLTVTTVDTRSSTTSRRISIDRTWSHHPLYDDAPDFILKDVLSNENPGGIVLETVVTNPVDCKSLKLCGSDVPDAGVIATIALTLYEQNRYSSYCTKPTVN